MFRRIFFLVGIGLLTLANITGAPNRADARPGFGGRWYSRSSFRYVPQRGPNYYPSDRGESRYTYPP
jgi:hypothetical protein